MRRVLHLIETSGPGGAERVLLNLVDLQDNTADCDDNLWQNNVFDSSVSDDCVD